jgi:RNA 3'-terminal phosphate cyclase (ATP)
MIEIDGSRYSGSGTVLRYSVALATLLGKPLHVRRIRSARLKPGLRPQHLLAVRACASLSGGSVEGDEVGSQEIVYRPGSIKSGGELAFDIGTAGSTTMLAFTLIAPALYGDGCRFTITGGLFQDFAPSAFHMQKVLLPILRRMGAEIRIEVLRPGYVPKGKGKLLLEVAPLHRPLSPFRSAERGEVSRIRGISLASHLDEQKVAERMADQSRRLLNKRSFAADIDVLEDSSAVQRGAALALWTETDSGALIGADRAGKRGRRSENIARFAVKSLLEDLESKATVDRYLADQLILFGALAGDVTEYAIPMMTDHVESNRRLVETILGARTSLEGRVLRIEGVGFEPDRR